MVEFFQKSEDWIVLTEQSYALIKDIHVWSERGSESSVENLHFDF